MLDFPQTRAVSTISTFHGEGNHYLYNSTQFGSPALDGSGIQVQVYLADGSPGSGEIVRFTLPSESASFNTRPGPQYYDVVADGNGVATMNAGLATSSMLGSFTLTVSSGSAAAYIGPVVVTNPNDLGWFIYDAYPGFYVSIGDILSRQIIALHTRRANGSDANGYSLRYEITNSGTNAAFSNGSTINDPISDGGAVTPTADIVIGGAQGSFTIKVYEQNYNYSNRATFTFYVTVKDLITPTALSAVGGNGQSAWVSTSFAQNLIARVTNVIGSPLAGKTVVFTSPVLTSPSCSFGGVNTYSTTTDANGYAYSPLPLANSLVGTYGVTATCGGLTANFTLTNSIDTTPILHHDPLLYSVY